MSTLFFHFGVIFDSFLFLTITVNMSANPVDSDFFMNLESEDSWPLHGCQRWLSPAFSQQSLKCLPSSSLPPPNPPRSVLSRALIKMEWGTCHTSSSFLPPWEYEPEAFRWPDLKSHTCCRCYFAHLTLYAVFFCSLPPGHIILLDANRGCKNTFIRDFRETPDQM